MKKEGLKNASVETRLIHSDRHLNSTSAVAPPIYQTATFRGDSAQDYLCQGFSEEIETQLSRADPNRLAVVARVPPRLTVETGPSPRLAVMRGRQSQFRDGFIT